MKQQMEYHEYADMFPRMDKRTYNKTKEDVAARGFDHQICYITEDGKDLIVDGRHREQIATELKIDIRKAKTVSGQPLLRKLAISKTDGMIPVLEQIKALNLHRRHSTPAQNAAAGAEIMEAMEKERERLKAEGKDDEKTDPNEPKKRGRKAILKGAHAGKSSRQVAAEMTNSKPRSVQIMRQIRKADPKLAEAVKNADMTPNAAIRELKRREKTGKLQEAAKDVPKDSIEGMKLILGDCNKEIVRMEEGSVNLLIADPPYNFGVDYGNGKGKDSRSEGDYQGWTKVWVKHCADVLKPDGSMFIICPTEHSDHIAMACRFAGLNRRNWITWYETFGQNMKENFNKTSRHILYLTKSPKHFTFNPDAVKVASARLKDYHDKRAVPGGKIMDNVWQIPRLVDNHPEKIPGFPNQIPLALMQLLVDVASNPGELVVDPFVGSGTTIIAALSGKGGARRVVGIDESQKSYDTADVRVRAFLAESKKGKKKSA